MTSGTTRRGLFKKGLIGTLALALGGGGFLAFRGTRLAPMPAQPLKAFDHQTYSVLHAVVQAVLPDPQPDNEARAEVAAALDGVMANADARTRGEFIQLLGLFENALAGFVFDGRVRPFSTLSPAEAEAALQDWRNSRLSIRRTGYQALKRLITATYYADPRTHAATGYPGPPNLGLPG